MGNIGARYEILGRIMNGTTVVAYVLYDLIDNTISPVSKQVTEQYALNKQIYNCTAQIYNNTINMKGIQCKLNKLPKYNADCTLVRKDTKKKCNISDIMLVGKVQQGRLITDYIVTLMSNPKQHLRVSRNNIMKLARENRIINAKAQLNCGNELLRAKDGYNLSDLKTYVINVNEAN